MLPRMKTDAQQDAASKYPRTRLLHNWISLAGLVITLGSLFSYVLLIILDSAIRQANPYIGILTYMIAPGFFFAGLFITIAGALWHRHQLKGAAPRPAFQVDLTRPRDRRILGIFIASSVCFLLISAAGSYKAFHFTESVQFCGQACHTVMQPELTTYLHGPHARVDCVECHVGEGATWYVKSKLSGTYQLYATAFKKYPTPIPTPIHNLRPARETCERCHWPREFVGNLDRTYNYFLGDQTNTPFSVRLLLKVGGGDPTHGPVGGIHGHMAISNRVEYIATDKARQKIPWVRLTDPAGVVTVFRDPTFTNNPSHYEIRTMDCMDCHNRPAHRYASPDDAVNLAISLGQIDRALPYIKSNAVYALTRHYGTETEARDGITALLASRYPDDPRMREVIPTVQRIYADNFFPAMKASWSAYPDNRGHRDWPGCFRCHDGKHKSEDGGRTIKANDCNACHTILTQGQGAELRQLSAEGQTFKHPEDLWDPSFQCTDCHSGGG